MTANTPISNIFFGVPSLTAMIDTAEITNKLKAAEPTMVEGPSSPGLTPNVYKVSITDSRISGADDPNAINVKLAIVGFQNRTLNSLSLPVSGSVYLMIEVFAVISSMAPMKMSETMEMPRKRYIRARK